MVRLKQPGPQVSVPNLYKLAASGYSLAAKARLPGRNTWRSSRETVMDLPSPVETQGSKNRAREPLAAKGPAGQGQLSK